MNREKSLIDIREMLARFKAEVEIANTASFYDVNIIAETVLIPFLNGVYDLNLVNINFIEKNFPAVDLVDEGNRIAIQVTSTFDRSKIIHTLTQFRDKKLEGKFDKLYVCILTEKKDYSKSFDEYLPPNFTFDKDTDIVDLTTIYNKIAALNNLQLIHKIAEHLKEEFSEKNIEIRRRLSVRAKANEEEPLVLNMVEIKLPSKVYSASINIDKNSFKNKAYRKKRFEFYEKQLIENALSEKQVDTLSDWTVHKGVLYTFRNLYEGKEPLRNVIDIGTIQGDNTNDFASLSRNQENILRGLIRFVLIEQLAAQSIEWIHDEGIFRFKIQGLPKATSVTWKKEVKNAPREVISEHWNKDKDNPHIIAFRHLAFNFGIYQFFEKWYLCIKPTWNFTSDGKRKSRFSKDLVTGLKLLENNQSVYGHFLFLVDYIKDKVVLDLSEEKNRYINILEPLIFNFSPIVEEDIWNPVKSKVKLSKIESNQGLLFNYAD